MEVFRICPVGDQAVLCEFDNVINVQTNDRVQYLAAQIKAAHPKGVTEVLPTYRSLLIFYDQGKTTYRKLLSVIKKLSAGQTAETQEKKRIRIVPCHYGGGDGQAV